MSAVLQPAPDARHLTIDSQSDPEGVTLLVKGEVDLASAPALDRELREAESSKPRRIVLDLAALEFIDSTGLYALFRARERATEAGRELAVTRVPDQAQRLFSLTGFKIPVV